MFVQYRAPQHRQVERETCPAAFLPRSPVKRAASEISDDHPPQGKLNRTLGRRIPMTLLLCRIKPTIWLAWGIRLERTSTCPLIGGSFSG